MTKVADAEGGLAQHSALMAHRIRGLEDFLGFASTPAWRSAVLFAAVAFAVFHVVALLTPPLDLAASAATLEVPQLANLIAILARFAVPLGFLIKGLQDCFKQRNSGARQEDLQPML